MTNREKKEKLTKVISYRISRELYDEIKPLLLNGETLNSYARNMIDVERVIPPEDKSKELKAVAILQKESECFDSFSKIFWGMINQGSFTKDNIDFNITKFLITLRRICHLLSIVNLVKSDSSKGVSRSNVSDIVFDNDFDAESRGGVKLTFRVTESLYDSITERAKGSESIHQICRLMLTSNYKIQPVDLGHMHLVNKMERFYFSRFNSMARALEILQEKHSDLAIKFVLVYRQISTLKFLMEESFGEHIEVVRKK